jgi:hypothetical protein
MEPPLAADNRADPEALRNRIAELELENEQLRQAGAGRRYVKRMISRFATLVFTKAFLGEHVKRDAHAFWEGWRSYFKDRENTPPPLDESRDLSASVLARVTRIKILTFILAVVPAAAIVIQLFVLVRQNDILLRQNSLIAFGQTTNLRQLLFLPPYNEDGDVLNEYWALSDSVLLWSQPNDAAVLQIVNFALDAPEIVPRALLPLLHDKSQTVSIGALRALADDSVRSVLPKEFVITADRGQFAEADLMQGDLRGAQLESADLKGARLHYSDLSDVNMVDSDARRANFTSANLKDADLSEAELDSTEFLEAYAVDTDFSGSTLTWSNLRGACLKDAEMIDVDIEGAELDNADLTGADISGLENWERIKSISGAIVRDVVDPPEGFIAWAVEQGAIADPGEDGDCHLRVPTE